MPKVEGVISLTIDRNLKRAVSPRGDNPVSRRDISGGQKPVPTCCREDWLVLGFRVTVSR